MNRARAARNGTPIELEFFCATEYQRVRGALALYIGDLGVASELTQDAFVRVCRDWSHVELMERPGAWVHRVAMNLANSWFRRRRAERRATAWYSVGASLVLEDNFEIAPAVRSALLELDSEVRAVIALRYFSDLTVAETASALEIPEGTVKTRTRTGLERLRHMGLVPDDSEVGNG